MSRTERLLELMHMLRLRRTPISGERLAAELGISLRTLYRDIAALKAQGARIEGEPGLGYALRPGYFLPPLMFTPEELEAIALGTRFVSKRADGGLRDSAVSALRKIAAVLPDNLRPSLDGAALLVGAGEPDEAVSAIMSLCRMALRESRKLMLRYRDAEGRVTGRTVWPVSLGYFDQTVVLAAWCELRDGFRHFRLDRTIEAILSEERIPRPRQSLFEAWRVSQSIPNQDIAADAN